MQSVCYPNSDKFNSQLGAEKRGIVHFLFAMKLGGFVECLLNDVSPRHYVRSESGQSAMSTRELKITSQSFAPLPLLHLFISSAEMANR